MRLLLTALASSDPCTHKVTHATTLHVARWQVHAQQLALHDINHDAIEYNSPRVGSGALRFSACACWGRGQNVLWVAPSPQGSLNNVSLAAFLLAQQSQLYVKVLRHQLLSCLSASTTGSMLTQWV